MSQVYWAGANCCCCNGAGGFWWLSRAQLSASAQAVPAGMPGFTCCSLQLAWNSLVSGCCRMGEMWVNWREATKGTETQEPPGEAGRELGLFCQLLNSS